MKFSSPFIALALLITLLLGTPSVVHAEVSASCRSRMLTELGALIQEDNGKILAAQFRITTLKLAQTLNRAKNETFESWIKSETERLGKSDKKKIREKLEKLYATYGEGKDRHAFLEKLKGTDYFKLPLRFTNSEVSVYLRAHSAIEENSPFDRLDSAALWAQSKISESLTVTYGKGSKEANMAEISTMSASHTGMMSGLKKKSDADIHSEVEKLSKEVEDGFNSLAAKFSNDLKRDCEQCTECGGVNAADKKDLLADLFEKSQVVTQVEEEKEEKREITKIETAIAASPKIQSHIVLLEPAVSIRIPESSDSSNTPSTSISTIPPVYFVKSSWSDTEVSALSRKLSESLLSNPMSRPENVNLYRDGKLSSYLSPENYPDRNPRGITKADLIPQAQPIPPELVAKIRTPIPLSEKALKGALEAYEKTVASGNYPNLKKGVLTVIDFDQPSDARRLYVIDLASGTVLYNTYTTHGGPSSEDVRHGDYTEQRPVFMPTQFSSKRNSPYSALGTYITGADKNGDNLTLEHLNSKFKHTRKERTVDFHPDWRVQERTYFTASNPITQNGSFGLPFFESGKFSGGEDRPLSELVTSQIAGQSLVYVYSSRPNPQRKLKAPRTRK